MGENEKGIEMQIPILMYHEVINRKNFTYVSRKTQFSYIIDETSFSHQMEYLYRRGFTTLSLKDMSRLIRHDTTKRNPSFKKYIVITFDDGFVGNYERVLPVLLERCFTGNFFVITGKIGTRDMLSWKQIREMKNQNMYFGSHTVNHYQLGSLKKKEILYELDHSKKTIEDNIDQEVEYLSLPHGSYNQYYESVAEAVGYSGGCTSTPGLNGPTINPFFLKRMNVPRNKSFDYFVGLCERKKSLYYRAFLKNTLVKIVKVIVGETRYLRVYNRMFGVEQGLSRVIVNPKKTE